MSKELDLELAEYGKNEMLLQAIDRAVLGGRMKVEAAKDCYDLYSTKCVVDPETCQVTLDNLPIDEGLTRVIKGRPLWVPSGPDPRAVAQTELENAALAGNVSAHGRLLRTLGAEKYQQWCKDHAAKPGKVADEAAAAAALANADDKTKDNPWSSEPGKWSVTRQGQVVRALGIEAAQRIAKAAGSYVGATKPAKAA
jgi:hypothetical protein